jgi:hypothetical protein
VSATFTLEVRGLQGLAANFAAADVVTQLECRAAMARSAERAHAYAFAICPVDTEFMRDAIETRFSELGLAYALGWEAELFELAGLPFYPPWVTQGHQTVNGGFVAARPVLEPAFAVEAPIVSADVGRSVARGLARIRAAR